MIIEELELENFRSYRHAKINFGRGITLILGENGAGKTSIFEAINFALFKEKSSNLKIDELITTGEKRMKIALKFSSDGREYRALRVRELTGKAEDALYEIVDGKQKVICRGEREMKSEIEKILKLSTKTFSSAVYIKQGEIDRFLFLEPGERKDYIGKLLGTDALEAAWERIQPIIGNYKSKISALENIAGLIKETGEKIERESREMKALEENLKEMESKIEAKQLEIKSLEEKEKKVDIICRKILEKKNLISEKNQIEEKIRKIKDYEIELKSSKEAYEKYIRIERELEELNTERYECEKYGKLEEEQKKRLKLLIGKNLERSKEIGRKIEAIKRGLNTDFEEIEKIREKFEEEKKKSEEERLRFRSEIEKIAVERGNLQSSINALENALKTLESAKTRCPICSSVLTEEHKSKIFTEYSEKRIALESSLKELEIWEKEIKKKNSAAEQRAGALQDINIELQNLLNLLENKKENEEEIEKIKKEKEKNKLFLVKLEEIKKLSEEKSKEKEKHEAKRNAHIAAKEFLERELKNRESYLKNLERLSGEIEEYQKTISESGISEERAESELKNLKAQLEKERKEFLILEKEKSSCEGIIKEKKKSIENLEKEIANLRQKEKERETLVKFADFLEKVRALFHKDELQRELRARAKPLIERHAAEVFANFELPFNDLKIDDEFNVFLYSTKGEERAEMLSGGEKIALALAMRIALSKTLLSTGITSSGVEMLLLDEPTIHLDEQRRKELVEIIKRITYIPQTIIVTHDSDFESSAKKIIFVEKERGVSKISMTHAL